MSASPQFSESLSERTQLLARLKTAHAQAKPAQLQPVQPAQAVQSVEPAANTYEETYAAATAMPITPAAPEQPFSPPTTQIQDAEEQPKAPEGAAPPMPQQAMDEIFGFFQTDELAPEGDNHTAEIDALADAVYPDGVYTGQERRKHPRPEQHDEQSQITPPPYAQPAQEETLWASPPQAPEAAPVAAAAPFEQSTFESSPAPAVSGNPQQKTEQKAEWQGEDLSAYFDVLDVNKPEEAAPEVAFEEPQTVPHNPTTHNPPPHDPAGLVTITLDQARSSIVQETAARMGCGPEDVLVTALDWYLEALFGASESQNEMQAAS